ncbi:MULTISPECIES: aminopeptidase [unclassified Mycobacterium]|uniref:aminopeptidase n=1 Tax=unclassified Mycobacterium TaxID=2642494 RepID=UPI0029C97876|nr:MULTISPECIES: aminopeptidase [unclassified Mycobacterium]
MNSRIRNVLVAAAVLIAGVAGLLLPISVFDGGNSTVGCGNAVAADESGPGAAKVTPVASLPAVAQGVPRPDFVVACDEAISGRRHWAIPLVIVGAVGLVVGVLFRGRRGVARGGV